MKCLPVRLRFVPMLLLSIWVSLTGGSLKAGKEQRRPPNIIVFLVDDMGWTDPNCYGNTFHETPNINRLASQGMKFTNAYAACPVCSPTRASIMTGKYPATLNLTDFIPGHLRPWAKLVVPQMNMQLPLEEVSLAEMVKPAGYVCGSFGKWHLGGRPFFPDKQGFDEWVVTAGRHFGFRTQPKFAVKKGEYLADFLTDRAEQFIEKNRDKPFLLYLPHYAVHIPLQAKQQLIEKYRNKKDRPKDRVNNPVYAAMVEHVDRSLGRLMQKLDELHLTENTVLIFFSDNGGLHRRFDGKGEVVMTNKPLRDEKGSLYEGGIREPCIIRWPGVVQAGSVSDVPICSVDFWPTIADIAGTRSRFHHSVDGVSLLPLLKGSGSLPDRALYWHYPHYHHTSPAGAIRYGNYKLIEYFEDGRLELYNLQDDIGETTDLARKQAEKTKQLHAMLKAWRKKVGAKMPTRNPYYDPQRAGEWRSRRTFRRKK